MKCVGMGSGLSWGRPAIPSGFSHEHLFPCCRASLHDYACQCCSELLRVAETQMLAEPSLVGHEQSPLQ